MSEANEHFLLSGTKPQFVGPILATGLNSRLASVDGLFGAAVYLAEKFGKIDQYTAPDWSWRDNVDMHKEFYGKGKHTFPGSDRTGTKDDIFYCMVVRTVLGWHMSTKDGETNADKRRAPIWVNDDDKRELQEV